MIIFLPLTLYWSALMSCRLGNGRQDEFFPLTDHPPQSLLVPLDGVTPPGNQEDAFCGTGVKMLQLPEWEFEGTPGA